MPSPLRLGLLAALLAAGTAPASVQAQTGVGVQVGDPTGLTLRLGSGPGALALAAGWDLGDDELSLEGHYVFREARIPGDTDLTLFYGPGVFFQTRDDETALGVSVGVGVSLFATRDIEIYGLLSPRLQLIDATEAGLGGGVGGRIYL
ncbi:MAG: hypothetical protein AAF791_07630 [Bacteroidota bacterium]